MNDNNNGRPSTTPPFQSTSPPSQSTSPPAQWSGRGNLTSSTQPLLSKSYGAINRPAYGSPSARLSHSLGTPEINTADIPMERKAEIVRKHLPTLDSLAGSVDSAGSESDPYAVYSTSHKLPGGEITHEVHKWQKDVESEPMKRTRSRSLYLPRALPTDPHIANIRAPGGFRRHYVSVRAREQGKEPNFVTRNFIEFLTMYGHFAGEELSDDEDDDDDYYHVSSEETPLVTDEIEPTVTKRKAVFLLLKSFVGTGVILLPRAFLNGGMVFSFTVLIGIATISLFAFLMLVEARLVIRESFGDIGGALYGPWMKRAVLTSITISQLGFVCAYMIFVAENLLSFTKHVFGSRTFDLQWFIWAQVFVFVPLALIRKISRLSMSALIADIFILFGLLYLYYYDIFKLSTDGVADIQNFNWRTFSLFIGTAVFTFEGVGLIIPIHEAMIEPEKFPQVLTGVMVFITIIFVSIGALSYAAFGSKIEPVVILNLPTDEPVVLAVQLLYALAIALSIPLQLFPAIRIMEQTIFPKDKTGKLSKAVKWEKNGFRLFIVIACAAVASGGSQNLDKFVSFIGAFACVPLCFLYPPLFHLKACARTVTAKVLDIALILFAMFAMVYTTYMSFSLWHEK